MDKSKKDNLLKQMSIDDMQSIFNRNSNYLSKLDEKLDLL